MQLVKGMPDTNGTQKCWQSIKMGLLGPQEFKKSTFEQRKSSVKKQPINCKSHGGNYPHTACFFSSEGGLLCRGIVGK